MYYTPLLTLAVIVLVAISLFRCGGFPELFIAEYSAKPIFD